MPSDGVQQLWGAVWGGLILVGCIADFALVHSSQASPEQPTLQLPTKGFEKCVYEFPFPPLPPLLVLLALLSLPPTSLFSEKRFSLLGADQASIFTLAGRSLSCPLGFCVPLALTATEPKGQEVTGRLQSH